MRHLIRSVDKDVGKIQFQFAGNSMFFLSLQANKTSILVDASKYIKELKDKVQEATTVASAADSSSSGSAVAATVRT